MRIVLTAVLTLASAAAQPGPSLGISVNGGRQAELEQGSPLIVHALLTPRGAAGAPVRLAPPAGTWLDAIRLTVKTDTGQPAAWNFQPVAEPKTAALDLEPRSFVRVYWVVAEQDTAKITPGLYYLYPELEITGSEGWNGTVRGARAEIAVVGRSSMAPAEAESARTMLRAQAAMLKGDLDGALRELESALIAEPASIQALQLSAVLLAQKGRFAEALWCAQSAFAQYRQENPDGVAERGALLADLIERLRAALAAKP